MNYDARATRIPKRGFLKNSSIIAISPAESLRRFVATNRFSFAPAHKLTSHRQQLLSANKAPLRESRKVSRRSKMLGFHDYDEKAESIALDLCRVMRRRAEVAEAQNAALRDALRQCDPNNAVCAQPSPLAAALAECKTPKATYYRHLDRMMHDGTFRRRTGSGAEPSVADECGVAAMEEVARAANFRGSLRSIAKTLRNEHDMQVSHTTVLRALKKEGWTYSKKRVVPRLTEEQMRRRAAFAVERLREVQEIKAMNAKGNYVVVAHLDEKQFYLYTVNQTTFSPAGEHVYHQVQSKTQIPKVMFIGTVATPIVDKEKGINFDGRVCFHPIVKISHYQSNTKNASSGDPYYETVNVDKAWFRKYVLYTVVPTLRSKCSFSSRIILQFDGAGGHGCNSKDASETFCASLQQVVNKDSKQIPITIRVQPPNSPDCNVLDLGLWNSLARALDRLSLELESTASRQSTMRIVFRCVKMWHCSEAWDAFEKISKTFDYLFSCIYDHIKQHRGSNRNELPHRSDEVRAKLNETLSAASGCDFYSPEVSTTPPECGKIKDYKEMTAFLKSFVAGNEYLRMLDKERKERAAVAKKMAAAAGGRRPPNRVAASSSKERRSGRKRANAKGDDIDEDTDSDDSDDDVARKIGFDDEDSCDDESDTGVESGASDGSDSADDTGDSDGDNVLEEDDDISNSGESGGGGVIDAHEMADDDYCLDDASEDSDIGAELGEMLCKCNRKNAPIGAGRNSMHSIQCSTCKYWSHTACYGLRIEDVQSDDWFCRGCAAGARAAAQCGTRAARAAARIEAKS